MDTRPEGELTTVSARLAYLEQAFLNDLDRVDREVMTEAEYLKRQEVRRGEQEGLQVRKMELESAIAAQRDMEVQAPLRTALQRRPRRPGSSAEGLRVHRERHLLAPSWDLNPYLEPILITLQPGKL